tara:strand:+ start:227 stop:415 length:189 start_codon:yes stop_codon:yes gene_type:complete
MTATTKPKTDFDKFCKERSAATAMRDDLAFLVGWTKADNPEIAKRLQAILTQHEENREQDWM